MARIREPIAVRSCVVAAVLLVGCGDPDPPKLTVDDVTGQAAGHATGSLFAGSYLTVSSTLQGCHCRAYSCGPFSPTVGLLLQVSQQDGALTVEGLASSPGTGGVNQDGTFWSGGVARSPDIVTFWRINGRFHLTSGHPDSFQAVTDTTTTGASNGVTLDCDVQVALTTRYQGP